MSLDDVNEYIDQELTNNKSKGKIVNPSGVTRDPARAQSHSL